MRQVRTLLVAALGAAALTGCSMLPGGEEEPEPTAAPEVTVPAEPPSEAMSSACRLMFAEDTASVEKLIDDIKHLDLSSPQEMLTQADALADQISADLEAANADFPPDVQPYVQTLQTLFDLENETVMTIGPWVADVVSGAGSDALHAISDSCAERGLEAL